jgi:hypothetical protein
MGKLIDIEIEKFVDSKRYGEFQVHAAEPSARGDRAGILETDLDFMACDKRRR